MPITNSWSYPVFKGNLEELQYKTQRQLLINTINAHSYNVAQKDTEFVKALQASDILLPDGVSIVLAVKILTRKKIKKIAGEDLFYWEMKHLEQRTKSQEPRAKMSNILNLVS